VVVNDDQLSLAIGKRGQNVRLAARLTGWDVDILTPPEFQAGVQRLEQTLKSVEGVQPDMVDKVIALGLIDVRDIEEVGVGPLMEELGLDEKTAQIAVERCAAEAKIVAGEQEAKKAADAVAKAKFQAGLLGMAPAEPSPLDAASEGSENPDAEEASRMPGAMEAATGGAPETTVHDEGVGTDGSELSPEEQAVHGAGIDQSQEERTREDAENEESETAALAEGRDPPPATTRDE
jgi:N utilization substance protein A